MGFGLPAAMGIKIALPDADVACVTGEGSIQMNIQGTVDLQPILLPGEIINLRNDYSAWSSSGKTCSTKVVIQRAIMRPRYLTL